MLQWADQIAGGNGRSVKRGVRAWTVAKQYLQPEYSGSEVRRHAKENNGNLKNGDYIYSLLSIFISHSEDTQLFTHLLSSTLIILPCELISFSVLTIIQNSSGTGKDWLQLASLLSFLRFKTTDLCWHCHTRSYELWFQGPERALSPWSTVLWAVTVQISPSAAICMLPLLRNQNHPASVGGQNISACRSRALTRSVRSCPLMSRASRPAAFSHAAEEMRRMRCSRVYVREMSRYMRGLVFVFLFGFLQMVSICQSGNAQKVGGDFWPYFRGGSSKS